MNSSKCRLNQVYFSKDLKEGVIEYARENYPNEIILLLKGRLEKGSAYVESFVIPPLSRGGRTRAVFNMNLLPPDRSIIGSIHSHPSGVALPSKEDLLYGLGPVIMIIGLPAEIRAFDKDGNELKVNFI
ncbi:MAG: Mov34/MPN/PAD-1 family protein [Conexivisphaerales archaeon]|nr:Mov34/MPN/PAD-1 family protein [Conexivisphaerales archaeon]